MENLISIPIKENWAGDYRLEYDGKYITLFGKDKNFPIRDFYNTGEDLGYEEMVLLPIVVEVRKANPRIAYVSNSNITIELFNPDDY